MASFERAVSSSMALLLLCFLSLTEGRDLLVGGKTDAWKIPSSESDSLNKWSERSRFVIGDSLVWKYDSSKDSVLEVSKTDYETCNTSKPIAEYKDGNTKVELHRSGPFYFISGAHDHCQQGQKLTVVVISPRHHHMISSAPAPSPAEFEGPAVAPASSAAGLRGGLVVAVGVLGGLVLM
ncbi:Early nodulin-like protein [Actinidia chinensis var. chinensis]|uniref:Early nodulin-like protein n=1 Tax=Actinidia chinensis var. chinensis TaxID=1590841 RepID=A0A2R6PJ21_ACTCC|nr:Early nodulin-like protein [Actinidia chinensis var. chinensis]